MLDAVVIKMLRLLLPLATSVMTPSQPTAPPTPSTTTYIPSPFVPGKITRKTQRRRLKTDIYVPSASPQDLALPVVINLHGSGFCFPEHGSDARFCALLSKSLPAIVLDVDYSHAPEHPWPAAVEDIDSAIMFVKHFAEQGRKQRKRHGTIGATGQKEWLWDANRIAITGFSSGGNLALIAGTRADHHGGVQAVAGFYPSTNLAEDAYAKPQLKPLKDAAGGTLPPWLRRMLYECYVPLSVVKDRAQPLISPLYAKPSSFPSSVTILTAEQDSLCREGTQMVERLQQSGEYHGSVLLWEAKGQGHNWDKMTKPGSKPAKMRDEAYQLVVKRIRDAFAAVGIGWEDHHEEEVEDEDDDANEADGDNDNDGRTNGSMPAQAPRSEGVARLSGGGRRRTGAEPDGDTDVARSSLGQATGRNLSRSSLTASSPRPRHSTSRGSLANANASPRLN
ncbi:alpha/beta-hydrolase [Testicularia cyperi]|uniref:Alpha/beta-hydrolase n=1 Tax=Testicularia cyperi TaxID=1882483 RepID=A0A317XXQ0_9BASI|nr:alpha/beta-hydrolase [Testicularia cyperi]